MNDYDVHSPFDLEKHRQKYIRYLEVIIFPDGHVEYAVPSHQEKLIKICCEKLGITRDELRDMVPPEYAFDVIQWLCNNTECTSVWTTDYIAPEWGLNEKQKETLLKMAEPGKAVYFGEIEGMPF